MVAAALVVVLVVFVVPISLLVFALALDVGVVLWVVEEIFRKEWWPRMLHPLRYATTIRSHRVAHVRHR